MRKDMYVVVHDDLNVSSLSHFHFSPQKLHQASHFVTLPYNPPHPSTTTTYIILAFFTENDTLYAGFQKVTMSEVTFAKSFLATLDKRPIKLAADHVSDPRKYSGQSPVRRNPLRPYFPHIVNADGLS